MLFLYTLIRTRKTLYSGHLFQSHTIVLFDFHTTSILIKENYRRPNVHNHQTYTRHSPTHIPCTKTLNASVSVPSSATLLATQVYLVPLSLKMVALMVIVLATISNSLGRAIMVGSLKLTLGSRVESNINPFLNHWMEGAGTPVAVHVKVRESVTLTI